MRSVSLTVAGYCLLVFLGGGSAASACSTSSFPSKIGRDFKVEVYDRVKPVVGLEIELSTDPGDRSVSFVKTDATGEARFTNVHPGLYYVGIKHPAFPYSDEVRVMRRPPTGSESTIKFEWPGWAPLSTKSVSGVLSGRTKTNRPFVVDRFSKPVYGRVAGTRLTLSKTISNEVLASVTSGKAGQFDFGDVPPGSYFVRVETPITNPVRWLYPQDGYVPLEVNASAKLKKLNLVLDNAICGELGWSSDGDDTRVDAETH